MEKGENREFDSFTPKIGQIFAEKHQLINFLRKFSETQEFDVRFPKSDELKVEARCCGFTGNDEVCSFNVISRKISSNLGYEIKKICLEHTHVGSCRRKRRMKTDILLSDCPSLKHMKSASGYKPNTPKLLREVVEVATGGKTSITNRQAQNLLKKNNGNEVEMGAYSFSTLPDVIRNLQRGDPSGSYHFEVLPISDEELIPYGNAVAERKYWKQFRRCFVCCSAMVHLYKYSRRVLALDGTHLKGPFKGILLTACCKDANNGVHVVAFAIVGQENSDNWQYFLMHLRAILERIHIIICDYDKGLNSNETRSMLPHTIFTRCAFHMLQNLKNKFAKCGGSEIQGLVMKLARAVTEKQYLKVLECIRDINPEASVWLDERKEMFVEYIVASKGCSRFGDVTSNASEQSNSGLLEIRKHSGSNLIMKLLSRTEEKLNKSRKEALKAKNEKKHTITDAARSRIKVLRGYSTRWEKDSSQQLPAPNVNTRQIVVKLIIPNESECHKVLFTFKKNDDDDVLGTHESNEIHPNDSHLNSNFYTWVPSIVCECNHNRNGIPCIHSIVAMRKMEPEDPPGTWDAFLNKWTHKVFHVDTYIQQTSAIGQFESFEYNKKLCLPPQMYRPRGRIPLARIKTKKGSQSGETDANDSSSKDSFPVNTGTIETVDKPENDKDALNIGDTQKEPVYESKKNKSLSRQFDPDLDVDLESKNLRTKAFRCGKCGGPNHTRANCDSTDTFKILRYNNLLEEFGLFPTL